MRLSKGIAAPYAAALNRVIAAELCRGADPERLRGARALLADVLASAEEAIGRPMRADGLEGAHVVDLATYRRERLLRP
jgi:hypothetical protein